jgi:serine/threonine protein kinase
MTERLASAPPVIPGCTYIRLLGSGGFADVYLYQQEFPGRKIAVKVLREKSIDKSVQDAFVREANMMAKWSGHPSILTMYEAGLSANGRAFLSSELCEPTPARTWRTQPMTVERVLEIGVNLCSALGTVHHHKLTHRDVKPSNILTTEYGQAVLADFGVAIALEAAGETEQHAMSVPWSAPEVISLQTTGTVASEVWSLGATLYSLLAGRSPFENVDSTMNTASYVERRIMKAIVPPLGVAGVPQVVEAAIVKAMAKDPSDRYQSMYEFALELNAIQAQLGLRATALMFPSSGSPSNAPESLSDVNPSLLGSVVQVKSSRKRRAPRPVPYLAATENGGQGGSRRLSPITLTLAISLGLGFVVTLVIILSIG